MRKPNINLTNAEWNLMECLWEAAPRTGREAIDYLARAVGWKKSTTLTMLRRMTEKGVITCDSSNGIRLYYPAIKREEAMAKETDNFLSKVYKGSISLMISTITRKQTLSKKEIAELYAILEEAEDKK